MAKDSECTILSELVPKFLLYAKVQRGWSETTIKQYSSRTRMFCRWLADNATVDDFTPSLLKRYLYHLSEQKWRGKLLTTTTIRSHFSALRAFGEWLAEIGLLDAEKINPARTVKLPKKNAPEVKRIEDVTANELLSAADRIHNERRSLLAGAVMSVFLHTGVRRAELLGLKVDHINLRSGILTVFHGKGDKNREIPLFSETIIALRKWLAVRGKNNTDALFSLYKNRPLGVNGLTEILRDLAAIAGYKGMRVLCHPFRHNAATWLHNEKGLSASEVQIILGHAYAHTTSGYLKSDVASIHRKVNEMSGRSGTVKQKPMVSARRSVRVAL